MAKSVVTRASRAGNHWDHAITLHQQAISALLNAAQSIPFEIWTATESGKWSPAHVFQHLKLAYEVLIDELNGGTGMGLRMSAWKRFIARNTVARRILAGAPFPKGARAPRETRPETFQADRDEAITEIQLLAQSFEDAMTEMQKRNPRMQLTHAYFGKSGLCHSLLFCARHIQHHTKHLKQ